MMGVGGLAACVSAYGMDFRLPRLTGLWDELVFSMTQLRSRAQVNTTKSHETVSSLLKVDSAVGSIRK